MAYEQSIQFYFILFICGRWTVLGWMAGFWRDIARFGWEAHELNSGS